MGLITVVSFLLATQPVHAQNNNPSTPITADNFKAWNLSNFSLENLFWSGKCVLAITKGCNIQKWDSSGQAQLSLYTGDGVAGGAVAGLSSAVVAMYIPPTSTKEYLADIGRHIGVTPAYAQVTGSGSGIINPIKDLWAAVQKVTFLLFIFIFIAIGFMIMFRQKINPQTVVTAQAALPGLTIGLILVTFSYFIAALLIDLAFVGIPLVANVFTQAHMPSIYGDAQKIQDLASQSNVLDLFTSAATNTFSKSGDVAGAVSQIIDSAVPGGRLMTGAVGALVAGLAFPPLWFISAPIGGLLGGAAPEIVGAILPFILILALFIQLFKLFFKLLNAYITLLVTTIVGPLFILIGSIPGKNGVITLWWKALLANALIFPAVFAVFLFAGMLLGANPDVFQATPPLFGNLKTGFIQMIIAYGVILGSPAVPDMVKNALGVKDIQGLPQAAMAGFVGGYESGRSMAGTGWKKGAELAGWTTRKKEIEQYRENQIKANARRPSSTYDDFVERLPGL